MGLLRFETDLVIGIAVPALALLAIVTLRRERRKAAAGDGA